MSSDRKPVVRCAIYTRKSSDEGLEQSFNSLDAQREASEAFILSQRHEGWHALPTRYDDGGYSGGSMERPALKRLLQDVHWRNYAPRAMVSGRSPWHRAERFVGQSPVPAG
jgi:site-specific DNA recombinase